MFDSSPAAAQPLLFLFDIDGTLLRSGGAGQEAMFRTLADAFGRTDISGDIAAAGRTDFAITSDLYDEYEIDATDEVRQQFHDTYTGHLRDVLPELSGRVLPGVRESLDRLRAIESVTLGLLTGNYFEAAVVKLRHFKLSHYFCELRTLESTIGGYGDHDRSRDDVARRAMRAARSTDELLEPARTWVIGDTPADVQCGRAIDAKTIAVATGQFDRDTLAAAEPDLLLDTLEGDWIDRVLAYHAD